MIELKSHTFPTDQLSQKGKDLLKYAQNHHFEFGLSTILTTAGVTTISVPLTLEPTAEPAVGWLGSIPRFFFPPAPSERSFYTGGAAAAWQTSIGNVRAGSLVATLQSMTVTGALLGVGGGLIGVGVGVLVGSREWEKGVEWAGSVNWAKGAGWAGWAQAAGMAGSEAWIQSEVLARSVDPTRAVEGAEWAMREAVKGTQWAAMEAFKGTQWAGREAVNGTQWAGREAVNGTQWAATEAVNGAQWAAMEAVNGAQWAFTGGWW